MTLSLLEHQHITDVTYIVFDFETVTHKGFPPEPVELGALRIAPPGRVDADFVVDWFIQPPAHTPITPQYAVNWGIRPQDVAGKPLAPAALTAFDALLQDQPHVMVAHNAPYDASLLQRYAEACPHILQQPFVDTVKLARHLLPALRSHSLDAVAEHFSLSLPLHRHRALPDVRLTCDVLLRLLALWRERYADQRLRILHQVAGISVGTEPVQPSLF